MNMNDARKAKALLLEQSCKQCRFYSRTKKDGINMDRCGVMVDAGGPWRPLPSEEWCEDYTPSTKEPLKEIKKSFSIPVAYLE